MKHVEDYYIIYQYQNPNLKFIKRVYIATDEPSIFKDARTKYEIFFKNIYYYFFFVIKDIQIMNFMVIQLLQHLLNLIQDMEQNH